MVQIFEYPWKSSYRQLGNFFSSEEDVERPLLTLKSQGIFKISKISAGLNTITNNYIRIYN